MGCQACRDCQHWVMDESRCPVQASHYRANFGLCMFPVPDLPFWSRPPSFTGAIHGRMTDAGAGATCKVFEGRSGLGDHTHRGPDRGHEQYEDKPAGSPRHSGWT